MKNKWVGRWMMLVAELLFEIAKRTSEERQMPYYDKNIYERRISEMHEDLNVD